MLCYAMLMLKNELATKIAKVCCDRLQLADSVNLIIKLTSMVISQKYFQ